MRKDHAGGFDGVAPWLGLALALLGLATAVYLSVLHWQVHNVPGHVSFCALSEKVNCDTVALSPQSWLLGVPVSTWAALYYLLFACLLAWGWLLRRPPFPRHLLAAMQGPALGLSVYLALVASGREIQEWPASGHHFHVEETVAADEASWMLATVEAEKTIYAPERTFKGFAFTNPVWVNPESRN